MTDISASSPDTSAPDTSPNGTLAQLTDVLAALTESQDLLLRKVQQMRRARTAQRDELEDGPRDVDVIAGTNSSLPPVDNTNLAREPNPMADAHATVDSSSVPSTAVEHAMPPDAASDDTMTPHTGIGGAPLHDASPTNGAVANAVFRETESTPTFTPSESAPHDYNFFDELDARLADIDDDGANGPSEN